MNDVYGQTDRLYDENYYIDMWLKDLGTSPVQPKNNWNEERIDMIGRNGNDGLHYKQSVEYYPPGDNPHEPPRKSTISMNPDRIFLDKLISDHWNYIEGVLDKAGTYPTALSEIEYHYKTAFAHGWRHAKEYYTGSV